MKLESDHVVGLQTLPRKSYNPFDSDDEIEATNGCLKSSLSGYDIRSFETNDDSLTFHLDSSDLSWEEAIVSHSQLLSRAVPVDSDGEEVLFRNDAKLFTDKTVTDTDLPEMMVYYKDNTYQSVKDIGIDEGMPVHNKVSIKSRDNDGSKIGHINGDEHQELYMEGLKPRADSYPEKDISSCHWSSDSWKGSGLNNEALSALETKVDSNSETNVSAGHWASDSLRARGLNNEVLQPQETRADSNSEKDVSSSHCSGESLKDGGLDTESLTAQEIADQIDIDESAKVNGVEHSSSKGSSTFSRESTGAEIESGSVVSTRDPQLSQNDEGSYAEPKKKDQVFNDQTHQYSLIPSILNGAPASMEFSDSRNIEATASQPVELTESQDPSDNTVGNSLSCNSKAESGSIILDFRTSDEAIAETCHAECDISVEKEEMKEGQPEKEEENKEEISQHEETLARPPEAQSMSRHDEGPSDSIFNSGSENHVHGKTSFSAAMSAPSSITYTGPHAHTGSISFRSESSAGSTRSFAFPVLHAEWNSSPVRMAKAEQRNFRKQRAWVHLLVCCRF